MSTTWTPAGTILGSGTFSLLRVVPDLPVGTEDVVLHLQAYFVRAQTKPIQQAKYLGRLGLGIEG